MKLIDADALDAEMYHKSFEVDDGRNVWNSGLWIRYKIFEEAIRDAPTVDAVPVVRCKDCKFSKAYYHGSESNLGMFTYLCTQGLYGMNADDYCSRAERKEHETD